MSDLENIKADIDDLKEKISLAEVTGASETRIISLEARLISLQNTFTELLKHSAQPGN
jgi:hypothetical protein